ncbi:hypothetical protein ACHAWF_014237 [Thalassiosira exigua]
MEPFHRDLPSLFERPDPPPFAPDPRPRGVPILGGEGAGGDGWAVGPHRSRRRRRRRAAAALLELEDEEEECLDAPGWTGPFGEPCEHYASTPGSCASEVGGTAGDAGSARENCCACGGGARTRGPLQSAFEPAAVRRTTSGCVDTPSWIDHLGDGCSYYSRPDICAAEGGAAGSMGTAKDNCCACGGGAFAASKVTAPAQAPKPPAPKPAPKPAAPKPAAQASAQGYSTWSHFCGPKLVGGYQTARSTCSVATECKKSGAVQGVYGSVGNDCPKGTMCFGGIDCGGPSATPSAAPSASPTDSRPPTGHPTGSPSYAPTTPAPTWSPTTDDPTVSPTSVPSTSIVPTKSAVPSEGPTLPPERIVNLVTTRGSFCGQTYRTALDQCSPATMCARDEDCDGGSCHDGVRCTFDAAESEVHYVGKGSGNDGVDGDGDARVEKGESYSSYIAAEEIDLDEDEGDAIDEGDATDEDHGGDEGESVFDAANAMGLDSNDVEGFVFAAATDYATNGGGSTKVHTLAVVFAVAAAMFSQLRSDCCGWR